MSQPLHLKGALVWDGEDNIERDLFIKDGRIVRQKPNHALTIDLAGYELFPGLINAHDHLELNHFPRTKFREVYDNAHQWGEEVNARLNDEPFRTLRSYPIWDRLFIGGLKNLLCGATTVIHHGPKYRQMYRRDFPVRVLREYGWAHSLHFNTEEEIVKSYQSTPKDWPWFIHLAEGTDEVAAGEYQRLKQLGCVGENTVIVHGVGLTDEDIEDAAKVVKAIVVCPTTNYYLLNNRLNLFAWHNTNVMYGSDSRLTAQNDLLGEFYISGKEDVHAIEDGFRCFVWDGRKLAVEFNELDSLQYHYADILIGHGWRRRKDRPCVIYRGIPQLGNPDLMAKFPHIQTVACTLDGVEKRMNIHLARQAHRCTLKEHGLEADDLPQGKRFWFF